MSDISTRLAAVIDPASLQKMRDLATSGSLKKLYGFHVHSDGSTATVSSDMVQSLSADAQIGSQIGGYFNSHIKQLNDLSSLAHDALVKAQADYDQAKANWQILYDNAQNLVDQFKALPAPDEDTPSALVKDWLSKRAQAIDAVQKSNGYQSGPLATASTALQSAADDQKAVNGAIAKFQNDMSDLATQTGKAMGLDNVLVHEYQHDLAAETADPRHGPHYTSDSMSFSDQTTNLLETWAVQADQGVVVSRTNVEVYDSKNDPVDPTTGKAFKNVSHRQVTESVQQKDGSFKDETFIETIVKGDEAVAAQNISGTKLMDQFWQKMFKTIIDTVKGDS